MSEADSSSPRSDHSHSDDERERLRRFSSLASDFRDSGYSYEASLELASRQLFPGTIRDSGGVPDIYRSSAERDGVKRYTTERVYYQQIPKERSSVYGWLTVNSTPDVDLDKFLSTTRRFIENTKLFKWYVYSFEQRSEVVGEYHGYHVHLLFERVETAGDTKQRLKKAFSKFCAVQNPSAFYLRWIDSKDVLTKYGYIKGEKHGDHVESKNAKIKIDIDFRKLNLLDPYYKSWIDDEDPPTILVGGDILSSGE